MGNGISVTDVKSVVGSPTVDGRELTEQEIKEKYLKIGQVMIQRDLYNSFETEDVSGRTYITVNLQDGTSLRQGLFDEFADEENSFISQEADGTIVFENFSSAKITGTPNDDKYKVKNSFGCEVYPERGNDRVILERARTTNIGLYRQALGEVDYVDIDNRSGAYIGHDCDNDNYGPFGGYKGIKGSISKGFTGKSVFNYVNK